MKSKEQRQVEVETAKLEMVKEVAEKNITAQENKVRKARRAFQDICKHENVQETDAHDYHNNCQWTQRDCLVCGKYLGKY